MFHLLTISSCPSASLSFFPHYQFCQPPTFVPFLGGPYRRGFEVLAFAKPFGRIPSLDGWCIVPSLLQIWVTECYSGISCNSADLVLLQFFCLLREAFLMPLFETIFSPLPGFPVLLSWFIFPHSSYHYLMMLHIFIICLLFPFPY